MSCLNLVLSLTQYCFSISVKSAKYETLNQIQGDNIVVTTESLKERGSAFSFRGGAEEVTIGV